MTKRQRLRYKRKRKANNRRVYGKDYRLKLESARAGAGGEETGSGVEEPDDGKLAETGVANPDSSVINRTRCRCNCRTIKCAKRKIWVGITHLGEFWYEDEYEDGEVYSEKPRVIMRVVGGGQETGAE
jgi:hypothetical protein